MRDVFSFSVQPALTTDEIDRAVHQMIVDAGGSDRVPSIREGEDELGNLKF